MSKAKVYAIDTINGTVELDIAGGYFKLMVAPADVAEIELLNDGNQALQALAVPAGFYQRIRFNKIRIRHTGAQAIKVLVAPDEGGSDNFTGTFTIGGPLLTDNADGQAAGNSLVGGVSRLQGWNGATFDRLRADNIGGAGSLRVTERGFTYGVAFGSIAALNANVSTQILAPASNVNGVIVWSAQLYTETNAGGTRGALQAHTAAPNGFAVGQWIATTDKAGGIGANFWAGLTLQRATFVPAGLGLYWTVGQNEGAGTRSILYTVL